MKKIFFALLVVAALYVAGAGCSSSKKAQSESGLNSVEIPEQTIVPDTFVLPEVPETMTNSDDRAKFVVLHYWDRFDFRNRALIARPEITEQAFVDYIHILNYVPFETAQESLLKTVARAEVDSAMYTHFASLFEKYFYEPNSPFRNEEFYIPVVRRIAQSSLLTPELASKYAFHSDLVMKNRVGNVANDFTFTQPSGTETTLHAVKSEFTLLMFSNPGCSTCAAVTAELNHSESLNAALAMNSSSRTMLTVLTIYPNNDLQEWMAHLPQMPARWIHGYDNGMEISRKKLYDIKAVPTLYLLDKDKKVILKDTSVDAIESFFFVER